MQLISFDDILRRYLSGEGFVVFDTETSGLNTYHDDIIEIAGLIWQKGKQPETFQELLRVNPNKITQGAWDVHKIPLEEIQSARFPADVFNDFITFAGDRCLIAHNAKFDYEILNSNLIRYGMRPYQKDEVACTLTYAKERNMPGRLADLAQYYKVEVKDGNLHRALYDVKLLTAVLDRMVAENEAQMTQYSLIL